MPRKYLVVNKSLDKKVKNHLVLAKNTMQAINLYKHFVLQYLNVEMNESDMEINWIGDE